MSSPPTPTATELLSLAEKYEALVDLRSARDRDAASGALSVRDTLRMLSRSFPGSLRELDTLGLLELQRRARAARAAAAGGRREPWMAWILAFHRLTAAALLIKRDHAARRRGRPGSEQGARSRASELARFGIEPALAQTFIQPPGGRLTPIVLRELALRFAIEPRALAETLFPARRRRAETLH
jgi:hypothetical protein